MRRWPAADTTACLKAKVSPNWASSQHSAVQFGGVMRSSACLVLLALSFSLSCNWFSCKLRWVRRSEDYFANCKVPVHGQIHALPRTYTHAQSLGVAMEVFLMRAEMTDEIQTL